MHRFGQSVIPAAHIGRDEQTPACLPIHNAVGYAVGAVRGARPLAKMGGPPGS